MAFGYSNWKRWRSADDPRTCTWMTRYNQLREPLLASIGLWTFAPAGLPDGMPEFMVLDNVSGWTDQGSAEWLLETTGADGDYQINVEMEENADNVVACPGNGRNFKMTWKMIYHATGAERKFETPIRCGTGITPPIELWAQTNPFAILASPPAFGPKILNATVKSAQAWVPYNATSAYVQGWFGRGPWVDLCP